MSAQRRDEDLHRLAGGGELGTLMRALDWAATPLGAVGAWSPALGVVVPMLLANRSPLLLWWGPGHVLLYNDASREILGARHPAALGPTGPAWDDRLRGDVRGGGWAARVPAHLRARPEPARPHRAGLDRAHPRPQEGAGAVVGVEDADLVVGQLDI